MSPKYVLGDATRPIGDGPALIAHICNDKGRWGSGFTKAISLRWPSVEVAYRYWANCEPNFALGEIQTTQVEPGITIANMIAQHGVRSKRSPHPIRYPAVRQCLEKLTTFAKKHGANVHMPRIGCGLAGGTWDQIEPIIQQTLCAGGIQVLVPACGWATGRWSLNLDSKNITIRGLDSVRFGPAALLEVALFCDTQHMHAEQRAVQQWAHGLPLTLTGTVRLHYQGARLAEDGCPAGHLTGQLTGPWVVYRSVCLDDLLCH